VAPLFPEALKGYVIKHVMKHSLLLILEYVGPKVNIGLGTAKLVLIMLIRQNIL
jgi:hypothetical protein